MPIKHRAKKGPWPGEYFYRDYKIEKLEDTNNWNIYQDGEGVDGAGTLRDCKLLIDWYHSGEPLLNKFINER